MATMEQGVKIIPNWTDCQYRVYQLGVMVGTIDMWDKEGSTISYERVRQLAYKMVNRPMRKWKANQKAATRRTNLFIIKKCR